MVERLLVLIAATLFGAELGFMIGTGFGAIWTGTWTGIAVANIVCFLFFAAAWWDNRKPVS